MSMIGCPGLPGDTYPCPARIDPEHARFCSTCKVRAKRRDMETRTEREIKRDKKQQEKAARKAETPRRGTLSKHSWKPVEGARPITRNAPRNPDGDANGR